MDEKDDGDIERLTVDIEGLSSSLNALALSSTMDYSPAALAVHYDRLADLYYERYQIGGDEKDINDCLNTSVTAITHGDQVDHTSSGPQLPLSQRCALQASRLGTKYDRFGEPKDLDDAIEAFETAIAVSEEQHALQSTLMLNQANYLCLRYEDGGPLTDIKDAIAKAKAALQNSPSCEPIVHNDLSTMYFARWEREKLVADLGLAVAYAERAVKDTDDDDARLPTRLLNWANGLCALYIAEQRLDEMEKEYFIKRAIHVLERAVYVCHVEEVGLRVQALTKLARAHHLRFDHLKQREDIRAAISAAREAFKLYHAVLNPEDRPQIDVDLAGFLRTCTQEAQLLSNNPQPVSGAGPAVNPTSPTESALMQRRQVFSRPIKVTAL
jgi:tetratricopeptide (TPR) repeat protein